MTEATDEIAIVIGATGGIGQAFVQKLERDGRFARVIGLSRSGTPAIDLLSEPTIAAAAAFCAAQGTIRLVVDATGFLHDGHQQPEKSWRDLDAQHLARSFALNAIGPALLMKHLLPLLPREGRSVFVTLSAKVGSIGDNALGGWYGYRAAKAALNQLLHTAAIECRRTRPEAICVALHPGTVETRLSAPFARSGLSVRPPDEAVAQMLAAIDGLTRDDNGGFRSYDGTTIPW